MSCDDTFNPNAPYKEKLVVFAVLTTRSDTQYVRVHTTYPVTTNPLAISADTFVPDAEVTIAQESTIYRFRDTTLQRMDTSRYRLPVRAFVAYNLRVEPLRRYLLTVSSPTRGSVTAQATSQSRGGVSVRTDFNGNFIVLVSLAPTNVRAWIVRMYLEYEIRPETTWLLQRVEVPRAIDTGTGERFYPRPLLRDISSISFAAASLSQITGELRQRYRAGTLRLKRTLFVLTQMDDAYYAYYSTANGFPDSGTLRLDEPDYTNIVGGLGVFAMSSETTVTGDTTGNPAAYH